MSVDTTAGRRQSPIATSLIALTAGAIVIMTIALFLDQVVFTSPAARRAVQISAEIAYAVQLVGFAILSSLKRWNVVAAWGLTALLRFATLAAYGFSLKALALPPTPALISLVTFFFVTTLAEPWLIRS
jgi:hypothetical protein